MCRFSTELTNRTAFSVAVLWHLLRNIFNVLCLVSLATLTLRFDSYPGHNIVLACIQLCFAWTGWFMSTPQCTALHKSILFTPDIQQMCTSVPLYLSFLGSCCPLSIEISCLVEDMTRVHWIRLSFYSHFNFSTSEIIAWNFRRWYCILEKSFAKLRSIILELRTESLQVFQGKLMSWKHMKS